MDDGKPESETMPEPMSAPAQMQPAPPMPAVKKKKAKKAAKKSAKKAVKKGSKKAAKKSPKKKKKAKKSKR